MWHDSVCNTVQEPTVTSTIVAEKTTTWGESGFPSEFLGGFRLPQLRDARLYTSAAQPEPEEMDYEMVPLSDAWLTYQSNQAALWASRQMVSQSACNSFLRLPTTWLGRYHLPKTAMEVPMPYGGNDWLALTPEPTIEPDMPICDPHHHFWDLRPDRIPYQRYLLHELAADVNSGHNVRSTAFIEARSMYRTDGPEELRSVGEVEFVQGTGGGQR